MATSGSQSLPNLATLHKRHKGLTSALCACYSEAARVCLDRYHRSPQLIEVQNGGKTENFDLTWTRTSSRARAAWANTDDATRDGAYSICLATAEASIGLVAVSRSETRTGCDYYLGDPSAEDLEKSHRLEVSGVDHGSRDVIAQRLAQKLRQADRAKSKLPAYAAVVGFKELLVMISPVENRC